MSVRRELKWNELDDGEKLFAFCLGFVYFTVLWLEAGSDSQTGFAVVLASRISFLRRADDSDSRRIRVVASWNVNLVSDGFNNGYPASKVYNRAIPRALKFCSLNTTSGIHGCTLGKLTQLDPDETTITILQDSTKRKEENGSQLSQSQIFREIAYAVKLKIMGVLRSIKQCEMINDDDATDFITKSSWCCLSFDFSSSQRERGLSLLASSDDVIPVVDIRWFTSGILFCISDDSLGRSTCHQTLQTCAPINIQSLL